jgi:hypothetical protein
MESNGRSVTNISESILRLGQGGARIGSPVRRLSTERKLRRRKEERNFPDAHLGVTDHALLRGNTVLKEGAKDRLMRRKYI